MPSHDFLLKALDRYPLQATLFSPAEGVVPKAGIVLNSATGVHRRFYARFATYLAERFGYTVLTYDFRGIAESRPANLRAFDARIRDWPQLDMPAAVEWLRQSRNPPPRVFLLGHSAGGNLIGLMPNLAQVDGVVLIAAQLGYWRHWPRSLRHTLAATWYLAVPLLSRLFGYVPGWLGAGQHWPRGIAVELARWCRHPEYLFGDASLDTSGYAKLDAPLLAMTFSDDPHATPAASEHLLARFPQAVITRRHVKPEEIGVRRIGHFGFFRPFCEPLWDECARWLATTAAQVEYERSRGSSRQPRVAQNAANGDFRDWRSRKTLARGKP